MYPPDSKDTDKPSGKLRLSYEVSLMAFIFEQAGSRAIDGNNDILKIQPTELHQRTPLFIGSKFDVDLAEKFIRGIRR